MPAPATSEGEDEAVAQVTVLLSAVSVGARAGGPRARARAAVGARTRAAAPGPEAAAVAAPAQVAAPEPVPEARGGRAAATATVLAALVAAHDDVRFYAVWGPATVFHGVHVGVGAAAYHGLCDAAGGFSRLSWTRADTRAAAAELYTLRTAARRAEHPLPPQLLLWR